LEARDALQRQVPAPPKAKILQAMQELLGPQHHVPCPNAPRPTSRNHHLPTLWQDHPFALLAEAHKIVKRDENLLKDGPKDSESELTVAK
jgi:hypothetical protein